MKKIVSLLLSFISVVLLLSSCNQEKYCEHTYVDGVCSECGAQCEHTYENGVCTVCAFTCPHTYENYVCTVCSFACTHDTYENGTCVDCGYECNDHLFEKGVCLNCGKIKLSKSALKGRTFEYSYFELSWSENVTDNQKQILMKQFGVDNEDDLFVELNKELRQTMVITVEKFEFTSNGVKYSKLGSYQTSTYSISTLTNSITIDTQKFYYTGSAIYSIQEAGNNYKGLDIKVFYEEKIVI